MTQSAVARHGDRRFPLPCVAAVHGADDARRGMLLRLLSPLAAGALALALAPAALAAGGHYVFDGGTAAEQSQVTQALQASGFDWNLVPVQVTIHIARGIPLSYSTPGQTWLDASLLDSGSFSWGVVQMEYAQQVQYTALSPQAQTELIGALGAQQWCYDDPSLPRGDNACERFAATLAWSYWPSADNSMRPAGPSDWSASMSPRAFRTMLSQLIGAPDPLDGSASPAAVRTTAADPGTLVHRLAKAPKKATQKRGQAVT